MPFRFRKHKGHDLAYNVKIMTSQQRLSRIVTSTFFCRTMFVDIALCFWGSVFWIFWIMWFFPRKYKYRCIRIYAWFKDDKRQNMKFVTRSLRSLATKLHILAQDCWIFPLMVIFIGFFLLQASKSAIRFTGCVYQCRSVLENIKVTTSLIT
jgi:hypothetical protein